jgi:phosphoribosylaminoimidazole-succinocarboxamide synthase
MQQITHHPYQSHQDNSYAMPSEVPVLQTDLEEYLPLIARGKVREVYSIDDSKLLFVATDRISGTDALD